MKKLPTVFLVIASALLAALFLVGCADRESVEYIDAEAVEVWVYTLTANN